MFGCKTDNLARTAFAGCQHNRLIRQTGHIAVPMAGIQGFAQQGNMSIRQTFRRQLNRINADFTLRAARVARTVGNG